MRTPVIVDGDCLACGTFLVSRYHVCPEPEVLCPQPPPKPFVKRWDPVGGLWVSCMIENGKAWDYQAQAYTEVRTEELETLEREP